VGDVVKARFRDSGDGRGAIWDQIELELDD
jgi:hypothetical protein